MWISCAKAEAEHLAVTMEAEIPEPDLETEFVSLEEIEADYTAYRLAADQAVDLKEPLGLKVVAPCEAAEDEPIPAGLWGKYLVEAVPAEKRETATLESRGVPLLLFGIGKRDGYCRNGASCPEDCRYPHLDFQASRTDL